MAPVEGMARCINGEGIPIEVGQLVYIREIPNWPGHCIVLCDQQAPLVGYHLDRFELLQAQDPDW